MELEFDICQTTVSAKNIYLLLIKLKQKKKKTKIKIIVAHQVYFKMVVDVD